MEKLIQKILQEAYDLRVTNIKKLDGYESANFKISVSDKIYVLKIYDNDSNELLRIKAENEVLRYLAHQKTFPIPILTVDNQELLVHEANQKVFRLLTYIEGTIWVKAKPNEESIKSLGQVLAKMDKDLRAFRSPTIESKVTNWDLDHFLLNEKYVDCIEDPTDRKLVAYVMLQWKTFTIDKLRYLRKSVIHNDANDWNILTNEGLVSGMIDFGDMVYSRLIYEVAIAGSYIAMGVKNPIDVIATLIKSFHELLPLEEVEIEVLYMLIAGRLSTSVINSAKTKKEQPDNAYISVSEKGAWDLLRKWISISPTYATNVWKKAIGIDQQVPKSNLIEKRRIHIPTVLSTSYDEPIHMTSAAFQFMYDNEGNAILDAYNNIKHVGHCHPVVVTAGQKAMATLNTNSRYLYDSLMSYSEKLLSHFPEKLNKVFFVNSGSAASDLGIRLARTHTQRQKLVVLEHGYHGNTSLGIKASHYKYTSEGGSGREGDIIEAPLPDVYRGPYQSDSAGKDYAQDLIKLLENAGTAEIAAFIAEPIVGCGGQIPLAKGYLTDIYPYIRSIGGICISDEVQVGFGRLGKVFWGYELYDVVPDIVILGKPIGNGHPMAAVVCTTEIAESFNNGMEFFSSFGGNPVSCAIGEAVLKVIEEERLQENAAITGKYLKDQLAMLAVEHACIGDIRGEGLFLGIDIVEDIIDKKPDKQKASFIVNFLRRKNILTSLDGPGHNVIKIKPPLCFNQKNVHTLITELGNAFHLT